MPLLFVLNLQTKFEISGFIPKIWPGPQNVEMARVTLTTPTWGIVRYHKIILHVANLCTKFQVSSYILCRNISAGVKF